MKFILYLLVIMLISGIVKPIEAKAEASGAAGYETEQVVDLGKIVVTTRRSPIGLSEVTENVTVITEDEIKQWPVRNLSEALNYIPGVYIEPRKGFGRSTSISVQGADSRQVRVMIDGIPLNNHSSGQCDPSKFPIDNVARIEVIKGAASSMWGSALGGVINIITKDTGDTLMPKGSISSSFAEFRTQKQNFDLSGKVADLGYYLSSSYMESGGEGPRDDVLEKKAFGKVSYDLKDMGKIIASFGFTEGDVNSGELPNRQWQARPYRCEYGKIGWEADYDNADIRVDLKHFRQHLITKYHATVADEDAYWIVRYKDVLYQLSVNSTIHPRENDLLIIGADFDWAMLKSTYLTKAKSLKLQAPYINYTLKLDPLDWNFGLRYDHNSAFGQDVSPSFGAVYHLKDVPVTLIRATVSRAFNAPPLHWKYNERSLTGLVNNPDIKPERAWVYELGLESQPVSKCWIKLTLYRSDVSDAIGRTMNEQGERTYKNFQKFRRQGIEAQLKLKLFDELSISGAGAFNDIEDRTTRKTVKDADSPRQSFDLGLEYKNKHGFGLYLNGYHDYWNMTFDTFEPNDQKFIFDLKATQKIKNVTYFLNIFNLTNSKYWSDYYNPIPERYFEGGATIEW